MILKADLVRLLEAFGVQAELLEVNNDYTSGNRTGRMDSVEELFNLIEGLYVYDLPNSMIKDV